MFLALSDFTGDCNISQSRFGKTDSDLLIAGTEERILKELLGYDLYLKLIADLNGSYVPQTQKYVRLVNGYTYTVVNADGVTVNVAYKGIKPMLKYFTYYDILLSKDNQASDVGQVEPVQENSQRMSKNQLNRMLRTAYNKGVALYGYDIEKDINMQTNPIYGGNYKLTDEPEYDYFAELVKGSCFNFLYKYYLTDYTTWQFTAKRDMLMSGYL
jgi:hypothetical protein